MLDIENYLDIERETLLTEKVKLNTKEVFRKLSNISDGTFYEKVNG